MDEIIIESYMHENESVEKYLSQSIINYGLSLHKGEKPEKLIICCKNRQGPFLGAVMGTKSLNLFFITHIFVEENSRNNGIGSTLLSNVEEKARNIGCSIIRLNTLNDISHCFYIKNGYKETTRIKSYMNGFDLVYYDKKIS